MKAEIKRFILRALAAADGVPLPEAALLTNVRQAVPQATVGDVNEAKRELELGGYIHGSTDDFDKTVSWTLTTRGAHQAKKVA